MKGNNLLAIAVIVGAVFWPQIKGVLPANIIPGPTPVVVPSVPTPSAEDQAIVADVVAVAKSDPNARRYAAYWDNMADLVRLKPGYFTTTGKFRDFHKEASVLFFDIEAGQTTKMAPPTEAVIKEMLGTDDTKLDDAKALRCFNALQWASSQ